MPDVDVLCAHSRHVWHHRVAVAALCIASTIQVAVRRWVFRRMGALSHQHDVHADFVRFIRARSVHPLCHTDCMDVSSAIQTRRMNRSLVQASCFVFNRFLTRRVGRGHHNAHRVRDGVVR